MTSKSGPFNSQQRWEVALDVLAGDETVWRLVEFSYRALLNAEPRYSTVRSVRRTPYRSCVGSCQIRRGTVTCSVKTPEEFLPGGPLRPSLSLTATSRPHHEDGVII